MGHRQQQAWRGGEVEVERWTGRVMKEWRKGLAAVVVDTRLRWGQSEEAQGELCGR